MVTTNLVVVLRVGDLDDHLLEAALLPCHAGVLAHGVDGVVKLLILLVQEHKLVPQVCLLGGAQPAWWLLPVAIVPPAMGIIAISPLA